MRRTCELLVAVLFLSLPGCVGHKADTVVIVEEGGSASVMGSVEFVQGDGGFRPNVWKEGNVMIFRVTQQVADQKGEAGFAYRVDAAGKLERIESVDLTRSNEQLASRYGVKVAPKGK